MKKAASVQLQLTLTVFIVVSAVSLSAQRSSGLTLREMARKGWTRGEAAGCGWGSKPFQDIASNADLVIEGTLRSHRSYPTPDERDIFTDYEFSIEQVIFQKYAHSFSRPIIFKWNGGTVVFDGIPMTAGTVENGRRVSLKNGDHVVIFGRYDAADAKYRFGAWDVFYLQGNFVKNDLPTLNFNEGLAPLVPLDRFAAKVNEFTGKQ